MAVEVATFRDGRWLGDGDSLAQQLATLADGSGFVWIDLSEPDPTELADAVRAAGVAETALAVIAHEQARPRLEHHGDHLVVVLKTAVYVDREEAVEVGQLGLVIGDHLVLTVASGPHPTRRPQPRGELDGGVLNLGPTGVLTGVASRVVRSYAAVINGLDNDIDEIEAQVFSGDRGSYAQRIYRLKSEVQLFRRAVGALPDELEELLDDAAGDAEDGVASGPLPDAMVRLRGVRAEAIRVSEQVTGLDDLLNSALSAHLAQIGIRQNEDMRRISAWVAIAALPTAISAIYGMNFEHMPELDWRYGYFAVLGVMFAACLVLYRLFRRSGWL